jgi:phosphatidylserine/phosphatidylglycerophosphate/cardiolipin synthase-like enzyme
LIPVLPHPSGPPRIYFNPSREDLRHTVLSAIHKSRQSIFLCMFGLSDPVLLKALSSKLKEEIPLTVYYDSKGSPDVRRTLQGASIHPVASSGIMHQKVLILDDAMVFLGSTNFTTSSLQMHDNLMIGFVSPKIATFLQEKLPNESGYIRSLVGGQHVELWLLPDPKGHVLADLRKHIKQATRSLKVAIFTLTHPVLLEELIQAKNRGVDVTVIVDLHASLGASARAIEVLQKAGVHVRASQGVQLMHHKFMLVDNRTLVTGSANWTKSAFVKNSDCLFILHELTEEQRSTMDAIWDCLKTMSQKKEALK